MGQPLGALVVGLLLGQVQKPIPPILPLPCRKTKEKNARLGNLLLGLLFQDLGVQFLGILELAAVDQQVGHAQASGNVRRFALQGLLVNFQGLVHFVARSMGSGQGGGGGNSRLQGVGLAGQLQGFVQIAEPVQQGDACHQKMCVTLMAAPDHLDEQGHA